MAVNDMENEVNDMLDNGEHENRNLLVSMFDGAVEPTFLCDSEGCLRLVNTAFASLFGLAVAQIVGCKVADLQQPEIARIILERNEVILKTGITQTFEVTPVSHLGARTFEVTKGVTRKPDGQLQGIWGNVRDISGAIAAERKIVDTSDQEKKQMGALLNEGLSQTLSGIWLYARALSDDLQRLGIAQAEDARQIESLAKEAGTELKQLLKDFQMTPLPLDDENGLITALEYLAEQAGLTGKTKCTVRMPEEISFSDPYIPAHLYRIAQEAVHNATRHSKAKRLLIRLRSSRNAVVLRVEDNGIGFSPKPESSSGIGLQIMHYRARAIGATLEICNIEAGGTAVICTLPAVPASPRKAKGGAFKKKIAAPH